MSELGISGQRLEDIVKVEVVEDDHEIGGYELDAMEGRENVDKDTELLEKVASLLCDGPWLASGTEDGKKLASKLLNLGGKLDGWKKWEGQCRLKGGENVELTRRFQESESQFERMKGNKQTLRNTYDLEVKRRVKAEREVEDLRKKAEEEVIPAALNAVAVQTEVPLEAKSTISVHQRTGISTPDAAAGMEVITLEDSSQEEEEEPLDDQDETSSSHGEVGHITDQQLSEPEKAGASSSAATLPDKSYNLRQRSSRNSITDEGKTEDDQVTLEDSEEDDESDEGDKAVTNTFPAHASKHGIPRSETSGVKRFKCDKCEVIVTTKSNLQQHMKRIHNVKEQPGTFQCYVCNKKFPYKSNFMEHLKTHPLKQSYECKSCGKISKSRSLLWAHVKIHDTDRERKFMCPTCNKAFLTSASLANHMMTHQPDKLFKCPECPQRFKHPRCVKVHLATHSNHRPFRCELCEQSFKLSCTLQRHIRIHTGERPYSCHICRKAFTLASTLNVHIRTHQGEAGKIHRCPFCSMKFVHRSHCTKHQRRRHKSELASSG